MLAEKYDGYVCERGNGKYDKQTSFMIMTKFTTTWSNPMNMNSNSNFDLSLVGIKTLDYMTYQRIRDPLIE